MDLVQNQCQPVSVLSYISKISVFMSLLFSHLFLFSVSSVFPALCSPSFVFFLISDDNCRSQSYRWVNMTMWLSDQILNTLILLMMKSFFFFYIYLSNSLKDYSYNLSTIESPSGILVVFFPATGDTWSN